MNCLTLEIFNGINENKNFKDKPHFWTTNVFNSYEQEILGSKVCLNPTISRKMTIKKSQWEGVLHLLENVFNCN